jgi:hypothetical protein
MIAVCPNLETDRFQDLINFIRKHDSMVYQDQYVMTFPNRLTHFSILANLFACANYFGAASCGELDPLWIKVLYHTLTDQDQCQNQTQRQENIQHTAHQICPKVANCCVGFPR